MPFSYYNLTGEVVSPRKMISHGGINGVELSRVHAWLDPTCPGTAVQLYLPVLLCDCLYHILKHLVL